MGTVKETCPGSGRQANPNGLCHVCGRHVRVVYRRGAGMYFAARLRLCKHSRETSAPAPCEECHQYHPPGVDCDRPREASAP